MSSLSFPVKCFLFGWVLVIGIRFFGLMAYAPITHETTFAIAVFIVVFIVGFYFGSFWLIQIRKNVKVFAGKLESNKSLNLLIYITVFLSFICVFFMYLKVKNLSSHYGSNLSLEGFSEIRSASIGDDSKELGSSFFGMISSLLFGFPVLAGLLAVFYSKVLSSKTLLVLNGMFIIGAMSSFMTGGRFTAFTFILMYLFARAIGPMKLKRKAKYLLMIGVGIFILISGQIFLDRIGDAGDISAVAYLLKLCSPKPFTETLLNISPNLVTLTIYFEYYVAHGVNQLDVLLNAPDPQHFPYWGAYQLKTFVIMFNKLGFDIINSTEITAEIINPGVYFTEIGAMYLDFGSFFSVIVTFIFGVVLGIVWKRYLVLKTLSDFFISIIFLSLISVSSIVSLVGAGYFSAIIVSALFVIIFDLLYPLPVTE
ncbi:O-antigen polymerase [uncultured Arcticibacterium sp.]|uniref:O-antigen polymerase n=1 Tax=uncultured Arcticibacterium sp. TaxID=2173042 RepID=UPI0030FB4BEC